ncbi:YncE family protein [Hyalangium versicolor]|uniref:YncE family protein n=1 Tax=Hyalangium versicolor TaxID=2861190 RepID=UPI001CCCA670|nr:YncE family protein [Hyalangium versicolor]
MDSNTNIDSNTPRRAGRNGAARWLWLAAVLGVGLAACLLVLRYRKHAPESVHHWRAVREGVALELEMEALDPAQREGPLREGQDVTFRLRLADAESGTPYTRVWPAAWMGGRTPDEHGGLADCRAKVKSYLEDGLFRGNELDLNTYQILVLNQDASISVVDPRFSFGGSRLLAMALLRSPGADWALTGDQSRLFVSMPGSSRVALVDTLTFRVERELELSAPPYRVALQPDEGYLWVGGGAEPSESAGIDVISVRPEPRLVRHLPTGQGPHTLAFTDDSRFAFVANAGAGTVSVIDVRTLSIVQTVKTGRAPTGLAYSATAGAVYVTDAVDGMITVIDPQRGTIRASIAAEPGVGPIGFERRGRLAFVLNPESSSLQIIDAASNRIIQSGKMEQGPDQLGFTDTHAYVRHSGSETVLMVPLDGVGTPGASIPVVDFPAGQHPLGKSALPAGILPAPGASAVLVANPADQVIYYYQEGMAAPMGSFSTHGHTPLALQVLDRTLRESSPGVYETTARLKGHGVQDVAMLVNSPQLVHCFEVEVAPALNQTPPAAAPRVDLLTDTQNVPVGKPVHVRVRLRHPTTEAPWQELPDLTVLTYLASGLWHERQQAAPQGDGVYAVDFVPPKPGVYYVAFEAQSAGLSLHGSQRVLVKASAEEMTQ